MSEAAAIPERPGDDPSRGGGVRPPPPLPEAEAARAGAFLGALGAQPRHPFAATGTAIVVAHPADEMVSAGGTRWSRPEGSCRDCARHPRRPHASLRGRPPGQRRHGRRGPRGLCAASAPGTPAAGGHRHGPLITRPPGGGMGTEAFAAPAGGYELLLHLDDEGWACKQRMLRAHAAQRRALCAFISRFECFRPAPDYDFSAPPDRGRPPHERPEGEMTGARWLALAAAATRMLAAATGR